MQLFLMDCTYFQIICVHEEQALRTLENDIKKFKGSKIVGRKANNEDSLQLFMIQRPDNKSEQIRIAHSVSTFLLQQDGDKIFTNRQNEQQNQLFHLFQAPSQGFRKCYWIKANKNSSKVFTLGESLKLQQLNPDNLKQRFYFSPEINSTISRTSIIINNFTGKVLDVAGASLTEGDGIIQWDKHGRWNQRWLLQKQGKGIIIKSIYNNLCIDVKGQSCYSGAKIIQWRHHGGLNQTWSPELCGNGLYRFRACHEPSLFLAVKKMGENGNTQVEVSNNENPSMYWRIQGVHP